MVDLDIRLQAASAPSGIPDLLQLHPNRLQQSRPLSGLAFGLGSSHSDCSDDNGNVKAYHPDQHFHLLAMRPRLGARKIGHLRGMRRDERKGQEAIPILNSIDSSGDSLGSLKIIVNRDC